MFRKFSTGNSLNPSRRSRRGPSRLSTLARYAWAGPTTVVGLAFVLPTLLTGGRATRHTGVLELHGGFARWFLRRPVGLILPGGAAAMTLGHVVLGLDADAHDLTRAHERVHVRQAERWGPLFLPAYGLASLTAWCRGDNAYRGNRFEREAYDTAD